MDSIFSPSLPVFILVTTLIALIPIILHFVVFKSSAGASIPRFLLLGPSGSGKTSLCLWFEKGPESHGVATQTSQSPLSIECDLPASICASAKYRSENDPSLKNEVRRFFVVDTPGHAKLRHIATGELGNSNKVKGVVFVVDSADGAAGITKAAEYLHDVLLTLQKLRAGKNASSSSSGGTLRFLIACNKNDLFTALPAARVKAMLEKEITRIRESRAKGLRGSDLAGAAAGSAEDVVDEENEWLGEGGEGEFRMEMMEDVGVEVLVKGGSVEKGDCDLWRQWLGSSL